MECHTLDGNPRSCNSSDTVGIIGTGAFIGALVGAAIGSFCMPGIGTALGIEIGTEAGSIAIIAGCTAIVRRVGFNPQIKERRVT